MDLNGYTDLAEVPLDELILLIFEYMEANGMLDELFGKYSDKE